MKASELNLIGAAQAGAAAIERAFPRVDFTSGRRNVKDQARAMAQNVVHNRQWIKQTYKLTTASMLLQKWVDDNERHRTQAQIEAGLLKTMSAWDDALLRKISKHFTGEAFDVRPVGGTEGKDIKDFIRKLPGLTFLEREGGLVRWHCQVS